MFVMLVYALSALASCFTIFGAMNVPHVTDAVVTYGVSGDDAPNTAMWVNSYGSLAMGAATWALTWFMRNKLGFNGPLYLAVMNWVKNPTDRVATWQLFMEGLELFIKFFVKNPTPDDVAAIEYIKKWATDKFVQHATTVVVPPASK